MSLTTFLYTTINFNVGLNFSGKSKNLAIDFSFLNFFLLAKTVVLERGIPYFLNYSCYSWPTFGKLKARQKLYKLYKMNRGNIF